MKRFLTVILTIIILTSVTPGFGGQFLGGKGFLHTNTALVLPPGALDLSLYTRAYADPFSDLDYIVKNGTCALSTAFGFNRHIELGFTQILYQDLNGTYTRGEQLTSLTPGDTYIRFKFGNYTFSDRIYWSFMPSMRYRLARFHDIHLEPYQGDGVEADLNYIISYFEKPLYPDDGLSVHFNIGYINHNDAVTLLESSQQIHFLFSFMKPRKMFDFGAELFGSSFIKRPPKRILGREDWIYITPLMRYRLFKGLFFTLGLDVLLLGYDNTSVVDHINLSPYPNYSSWRLSTRVQFSPSTAFYAAPTFAKPEEAGTGRVKRSYDRSTGDAMEFFDRQALFKWAVEERTGEIEAVDLDLEKIRQERKKAEEELQRLKRELEEKKRKKSGK